MSLSGEIRIISVLSENRYLQVYRIAELSNLSISAVETYIKRLKKNRLINTVKGPGGGIILTKPLNEITLNEFLKDAPVNLFIKVLINNLGEIDMKTLIERGLN